MTFSYPVAAVLHMGGPHFPIVCEQRRDGKGTVASRYRLGLRAFCRVDWREAPASIGERADGTVWSGTAGCGGRKP